MPNEIRMPIITPARFFAANRRALGPAMIPSLRVLGARDDVLLQVPVEDAKHL